MRVTALETYFLSVPLPAPQPLELFALRGRQPIAAETFIESGLLDFASAEVN